MAINSVTNSKSTSPSLQGLVLMAVILLFILPGFMVVAKGDPLNLSGSIGFNYRSLSQTDGDKVVSNQLQGTINASTYLWQPWFATVGGRLSVTLDSADYTYSAGQRNNDSQIITGELDLNVLPRSRTPLSLIFYTSDSRVDTQSDSNLLVDSGQDYKTHRLDLRQTWMTSNNNYFQGRFSKGRWVSGSDSFDDQNVGLEARLNFPGQTLTTTLNSQTTSYSKLDKETENRLLDVDHFWRPTESLTIDSMFSLSRVDTSLSRPALVYFDDSTINTMQLSSFALWRSKSRLLTVNGGIRVADVDTEITDNSGGNFSTNIRGGAIYQFTKNIRGDISAAVGTNDDGLERSDYNNVRLGGLYQSDLYVPFSDVIYQWYASGALQRAEEAGVAKNSIQGRLGHNMQKTWIVPTSSSINLSLSQTLSQNRLVNGESDTTIFIDHSASLGWNKSAKWILAYARLFAEDRRDVDNKENSQQLINFQLSGTLPLNRRSEFNAGFTIQETRYGNLDNIATTSGQIGYYHHRIFGVTNLGFRSDVNISKVSLSNGVDRFEWDNRLDYRIGLLNCSLNYRIIDREGDRSDLMLVRLSRRF